MEQEVIKIGVVADSKISGTRNIKKLLFSIKQFHEEKNYKCKIIGVRNKFINGVTDSIQKYTLDLGMEYAEFTTKANTLYSINHRALNIYQRNIIFAKTVDTCIIITDNKDTMDVTLRTISSELVKQNKTCIFK